MAENAEIKEVPRTRRRRSHIQVDNSTEPPKRSCTELEQPTGDAAVDDEAALAKMPEWQRSFERIKRMRAAGDAPVDTMGCHQCHDPTAPPEVQRFQMLVALMLSSQTKDHITHRVMQNLVRAGCTVNGIVAMHEKELAVHLEGVSFWKMKMKHIKECAAVLKRDFAGDIPRTFNGLCKLRGVGPKMAHLCMLVAWKEVTGIAVDTHVHRIVNRLGWVTTKRPEETMKRLEELIPREFWKEVNLALVGFGQTVCTAVRPKCGDCANRKTCPSSPYFGQIN